MRVLLIPIEVKFRELDSKIALAHYVASKKKFKVILFAQKDSWKLSYRNCIYFDKSISNAKIQFIKDIKKNNEYIYLDEEGPYSLFDNFTRQIRLPQSIAKILKYIILYGSKDKKFFNNKNFLIAGNPKYDLLNFPYNRILEKEEKKIKKKYGNFIFFPSSFGLDSLRNPKAQDNFIKKNYIQNNKQIKDFNDFKVKNRELNLINYQFFIEFINKISKEFPHLNIIVRPHPYQDQKKFKSRFIKRKNLKIIYKYNILPWIKVSKIYAHGGCSSVFDAIKLNKPIFYLNKKTLITKHLFFNKIGTKVKNINAAKKSFNLILNKKNYKNILRGKSIVENYIKNINEKSFNKPFYNFISKNFLKDDSSQYQLTHYKKSKTRAFMSKLKSLIFTNKYFSKEYNKQKLDKISLNEIKNKINIINIYSKDKVNVKKLTNNVFEIS